MQIICYAKTLWYLLQTDFKIFKRTIGDKLINFFIWASATASVSTYLLPAFGLEKSYSNFMAATIVACAGLFEVFPSVVGLVTDFEGNNITSFYLTLPIPSWLIFVRNMIFYAVNAAMLSIFVIPISKLILWHRFDISQLNLPKFVIIFLLVNIFYATYIIWITSRVMSIEKIGNVWMRFVFPIWFLGGFQFSWKVLYDFSPLFAYLDLVNPMIYIMEGTRAAVLGQAESLNFWLCAFMLALFCIACGWHGILRLKKRLDFI